MKFLHLVFLLKQIRKNTIILYDMFIYVSIVLGSKCIHIYSCILKQCYTVIKLVYQSVFALVFSKQGLVAWINH